MGIFEWVKSQTGAWGPALLDLYFQNAGWINAVVVAYGLLLLLSWQNLSRVIDALADQILEQAREIKVNRKEGSKPVIVHLDDFQLSWERAFTFSKFPFVAKGSGFFIQRSSLENVRAMISERDLAQRCSRQLDQMGLRLEWSK